MLFVNYDGLTLDAGACQYAIYIKSRIAQCPVPVRLNLDHGNGVQVVFQAISAGSPSVMHDDSKLPFAENLANSRAIAAHWKPLHISVEAELGSHQDGRQTCQGVEVVFP